MARHEAAPSLLKIGDVARQAELSIDAVRFYEREGLLGRVKRSSAGQRQYDDDTVRRLAFVRRATALGFSLAEVKSLLTLRVSTRMPCEFGGNFWEKNIPFTPIRRTTWRSAISTCQQAFQECGRASAVTPV